MGYSSFGDKKSIFQDFGLSPVLPNSPNSMWDNLFCQEKMLFCKIIGLIAKSSMCLASSGSTQFLKSNLLFTPSFLSINKSIMAGMEAESDSP